jgi:membrane protease YdiL (CAAX protease family)
MGQTESEGVRELSIWDSRRAPLWIIIASLALNVIVALFVQFIVAPHHWLTPISRATQGFIQPTLILAVPAILIQIVWLLIYAGGLRPADIGFVPSRIWSGVVFTMALWLIVNAGLAVSDFVNHSPLVIDDSWSKLGVLRKVGRFIGQIFGNTPLEEITFRGFLLVQLALTFRPLGQTRALVIALIVSQSIFGLMHVPLLIANGYHDFLKISFLLVEDSIFGLIYAIVYLATKNLFMSMGTHALVNEGMQVLSGSTSVYQDFDVLPCLALVASLLWWWYVHSSRRTARG